MTNIFYRFLMLLFVLFCFVVFFGSTAIQFRWQYSSTKFYDDKGQLSIAITKPRFLRLKVLGHLIDYRTIMRTDNLEAVNSISGQISQPILLYHLRFL